MEIITDILKITLPALLVLLAAWLTLKSMIKDNRNKIRQELLIQNSKIITPIRLQAYERIVLFLERISMESLIVRVSSPGMSADQLHSTLLGTIRSEFEHNLSQQIYMSPQAWEVVKSARSNMIKTINSEAEKLPTNSTGMELTRRLFEKIMELEKEPARAAIDFLKSEVATVLH
ncbi:MAG: hypothetical protein LBV26_01650 [Bacteroidales bacterium]|jgi:hypothetical protein|nr:hypothetical protein [Bacteroidales bacterium]